MPKKLTTENPQKSKKAAPISSPPNKKKSSVTKLRVSKKYKKTNIIVKFDAGFTNDLYIRGHGGPLSWEKGLKMTNIKANEWLWEAEQGFSACEFKVLINDRIYETGENHTVISGTTLSYTPNF